MLFILAQIIFSLLQQMNKQSQANGLLHVKIKEVSALTHEFHGNCKLNLRVQDQGYLSSINLSKGPLILDQTKMFDCSSEDTFEIQFSQDQSGAQGQLRFPLRKLTQMPRVKHIVDAMLIKKIDKDKRNDPNMKVENVAQVKLEIIYLNNAQGRFTLESIEVELIRNTEMLGEMDPYILITLDGQRYTTKAKNNEGRHCIWTERVELTVSQAGNSILGFRVYDEDPVKDDLICLGEVFLLKEGMLIPSEKARERQFNLFFQNQIAGSIKLEYRFELLPFNF